MHSKIKLCTFSEYSSGKDFLEQVFHISKSQIKKYKLNKSFLNEGLASGIEIELPLNLINHGLINPLYRGPKVDELLRTSSFICFNKPAKIHSHPLSYDEQDNLVSFIRQKYPSSFLTINREKYDRGLLYRLDYETSGLIIYALNEELYHAARVDIKSLIHEKKYLAIVEGELKNKQDVRHYIRPYGVKGAKMEECGADDPKGFEINARLNPLKSKNNQTMVEIIIKEGVRHQVRKHLELLGHPIIGDPLYSNIKETRMMLHCLSYTLLWQNTMYELSAQNPFKF